MAQSRLCWKFEIDSELLATVSGSMKMMCVCGQSPYHHHHYHDHLYCHHCHRHIYQQHTFGRTYNPYNVAVNASCQWFYTTISLQHILLESTDLAVPWLLPWLLNFCTGCCWSYMPISVRMTQRSSAISCDKIMWLIVTALSSTLVLWPNARLTVKRASPMAWTWISHRISVHIF